jgi:hypothetical protein
MRPQDVGVQESNNLRTKVRLFPRRVYLSTVFRELSTILRVFYASAHPYRTPYIGVTWPGDSQSLSWAVNFRINVTLDLRLGLDYYLIR